MDIYIIDRMVNKRIVLSSSYVQSSINDMLSESVASKNCVLTIQRAKWILSTDEIYIYYMSMHVPQAVVHLICTWRGIEFDNM